MFVWIIEIFIDLHYIMIILIYTYILLYHILQLQWLDGLEKLYNITCSDNNHIRIHLD